MQAKDIEPKVIQSLISPKPYNKFQRHILEILISLLKTSQIFHIREAFSIFDEDLNGTISEYELLCGL